MKIRRIHVLFLVLLLVACIIPFRNHIAIRLAGIIQMTTGKKTVDDRVQEFGLPARARLTPAFKAAGIPYPPGKLTLIGLKQEAILEIWASDNSGRWVYIKNYPIIGTSGEPGPKLKEGDRQIPEGIYAIESLNPNSLYHLALRVNYPNEDDRQRGKEDGRTQLGSDIMIHGQDCSIGCLAMGDEAAEDLFILAADSGIENITVILAPCDLRTKAVPPTGAKTPKWVSQLYEKIRAELTTRKRQNGN